MADKLIVKGVMKGLDGEYDCDIAGMMTVGSPEQLTNREAHRVKLMSGVRAGELMESFTAGDSDLLVAVAAVILTRHGKRFDEDQLWDAPLGSGLEFDIAERTDEEQGEESLPPTQEPPPIEQPEPPSTSGGESSNPISESPASDPSRTGVRLLETPIAVQDSVRETLAI